MADKNSNIKIIPTKARFMKSLGDGTKNGVIGALAVLIGQGLLGRGLGTFAGGVLGGAMRGGTEGTMIATVGAMQGMTELLAGSASSTQSVGQGVL